MDENTNKTEGAETQAADMAPGEGVLNNDAIQGDSGNTVSQPSESGANDAGAGEQGTEANTKGTQAADTVTQSDSGTIPVAETTPESTQTPVQEEAVAQTGQTVNTGRDISKMIADATGKPFENGTIISACHNEFDGRHYVDILYTSISSMTQTERLPLDEFIRRFN